MSIDIHFLNVGHGDCTIIEHETGHLTMIDVNNSDSLPATDIDALAYREGLDLRSFFFKSKVGSLSFKAYYESLLVDPVEYLASTFGGREVFRYIQTHPDMDHMSGLHRIKQENIPILNFWDTDNTKDLDDVAWVDRYDRSDWDTYQELRRSTRDPKALQLHRGAEGDFYTADTISILSPTTELVDRCNARESWNDLSYVIRIDHAGRSVILPGDAEGAAWSDMVSAVDPSLLDCVF